MGLIWPVLISIDRVFLIWVISSNLSNFSGHLRFLFEYLLSDDSAYLIFRLVSIFHYVRRLKFTFIFVANIM